MPKVTFLPAGLVIDCADGTSLFNAGGGASAGIDTACVGKGTCGLCRVKVVSGAQFLNPYTDEELKHLGNVHHITKVRLSCRTHVRGGDVVVELAPRKKPKSSDR
jgi:2Fe-2S ferredoxin